MNKHSFRRRLLDTRQVEATGVYETGRAYRPAQPFRQASTVGSDEP